MIRLFLLISTALLLFTGCRSTRSTGTDWISIEEATLQSWAGGAYGSGHGIRYSFLLRIRKGTMEEYTFDTVYIDNRAFVPTISPEGNLWQLRCEQVSRPMRSPEGEILEGPYDEQPPRAVTYPQFDGEAMIVGHRKGERFYLVVDTLTRLQPLNYP